MTVALALTAGLSWGFCIGMIVGGVIGTRYGRIKERECRSPYARLYDEQ